MEKSMMQRIAGFTLIELLIALVIVSILATLALPSYTRYLQRGDLVEGTQALSQYRVQMEQWYQDNNTYADATGNVCGVNPPGNPPQVNFQVTCALKAGTAGQAYTATATGIKAVNGFVYTIDNNANQATPNAPSGWSTSTSSWVIR
jgi:type IV pilus assembly protein PilE